MIARIAFVFVGFITFSMGPNSALAGENVSVFLGANSSQCGQTGTICRYALPTPQACSVTNANVQIAQDFSPYTAFWNTSGVYQSNFGWRIDLSHGIDQGANCSNPICPVISLDYTEQCGPVCVDNDGDGYGSGCNLGSDCDDGDPGENKKKTYYLDNDGDGYGQADKTKKACSQPNGYAAQAGDCSDSNADIHPNAPDAVCDWKDNDCDGVGDEDVNGPKVTYFHDLDDDTYPDREKSWLRCINPTPGPMIIDNGKPHDCDDSDKQIHPGKSEAVCNGVDNDCDGDVDETSPLLTFHRDADDDGWGSEQTTKARCEPPSGYVSDDGDCNDNSSSIYPGAPEQCNGLDDDCSGTIPDAEKDTDGDGFSPCAGDCQPDDPAVHPDAEEACNGQDDDCDGAPMSSEIDHDGDGFVECVDDCGPHDPDTYPGAPVEKLDGIDNDCNGQIDENHQPPNRCDLDGNGTTNVLDVMQLLNQVMNTDGLAGDALPGDINLDGTVNIADIITLLGVAMGNASCPQPASSSETVLRYRVSEGRYGWRTSIEVTMNLPFSPNNEYAAVTYSKLFANGEKRVDSLLLDPAQKVALWQGLNDVKYHLYGDSNAPGGGVAFGVDSGDNPAHSRILDLPSPHTGAIARYGVCVGDTADCQPTSEDPPPENLSHFLALLEELGAAAEAKDDPLAPHLRAFSGYDHDGDGTQEIRGLTPLFDPQEIESDDRLVLVLVEPRMITPLEGTDGLEVMEALAQYKADLIAEGYQPRVVLTSLYQGTAHQDGRIILALRRVLGETRLDFPNLEGVVLVGHFPDARVLHRVHGSRGVQSSKGKELNGKTWPKGTKLFDIERSTINRADIVLADLGTPAELAAGEETAWDRLYHDQVTVEGLRAMDHEHLECGDDCDGEVAATSCAFSSTTYHDVFFVNEVDFNVLEQGDPDDDDYSCLVEIELTHDPEVDPALLNAQNPMARPDIFVSRIDPRPVGYSPDSDLTTRGGQGLLGPDGRPQSLGFPQSQGWNVWDLYTVDPIHERTMLLDYFARNHAFRTGAAIDNHLSAAIAASEFNAAPDMTELAKASDEWSGACVADRCISDASVVDYIGWLGEPAVLKSIMAHSSSGKSTFAESGDAEMLDAVGGDAWYWSWTEDDDGDALLYPGFPDGWSSANFYLYRSLWANGVLEDAGPTVYIHRGCDVMNPLYADSRSYLDPGYERRGAGPALLFYGNGLALIARAKIFNDRPEAFTEALGEGANVGAAWAAHFEAMSTEYAGCDQTSNCGIKRKKAYYWSLLGDWTLTL